MKFNFDYAYFQKSAEYIRSKIDFEPEIALVLGSACGHLADEVENPVVIPYEDIPNFLRSTVQSHAGKLVLGQIQGKNVVCMSGRFHYYEGYEFEQLVIPIRVFHLLGVKVSILTNAAGAVNEAYQPGDIMLIQDHIKLTGASPLCGTNIEAFGSRFFDISDMYTKSLRTLTKTCAEHLGQTLHEGNYFFFTGPQFETPAEIRASRVLGADAVGMSTVTEALTAAHCGMKLLAFSLISNMAAGVLEQPITVEEVCEAGELAAPRFSALIREVVKNMDLGAL